MDNLLPLIVKNPSEVSVQGGQGKEGSVDLSALSATFADLLLRAGRSLGSGLDIFAGAAGLKKDPQDTEPAAPPEETGPDANDRARDRQDDSNGRPERNDSSRDVSRADHRDDHGRDTVKTRQHEDRNAKPADDGDPQAAQRPDEHPQNDNPSADNANDSNHAASDSNGTGDDRPGSDPGQAAAQDNGGKPAVTPNNDAAASAPNGAAQHLTGLQNAEAILSELLAAAETNGAPGRGLEDGEGRGDGAARAAGALQGLAKAIAALGNHNAQQQNSQAGTQNLSPELQALAKAIVETRGTAKPIGDTGPSNNAGTVQQQAQSLAQVIGEGNRAQINVKVTNEAATLISQPTSTLSARSLLAGDGQGVPLHAQQAAQGAAAGAASGGQQLALNNAGQSQQSSTPSSQGQSLNTLGGEAKASGPVLPNTAGQGTTPGGGEGANTAGSNGGSQETHQTHQGNQAQASNAQRFNVPRQAVLDQITVNISRAVQAGLDKINIQLRPESLGRVDVHLDMTKDGKVTAVVQADNKDTLDLLSRDAKDLSKALQDAGLQLDEGDITFNLRGQNGDTGEQDASGNGAPVGDETGGDANEIAANDDNTGGDVDIIEDDRINIRV